MPDSKITALTSISTSTDPANDPLVIVDVSDTSMAATGTTKKVTLNQLLATSPTATLASATITGDLTVDTSTLKVDSANNRVGIGTASPASALDVYGETRVRSGNQLRVYRADNAIYSSIEDAGSGVGLSINNVNGDGFLLKVASNNVYQVGNSYVQTWFDGAGGTRMTLNATGLGVGGSPVNFPNYTTIHAIGKTTTAGGVFQTSTSNNSTAARFACSSASVDLFVETNHPLAFYTNATEKMRIKQAGQVRFVPLAADPAGAEAGDVYYNSTSNKLKCYNGTTWNDLF